MRARDTVCALPHIVDMNWSLMPKHRKLGAARRVYGLLRTACCSMRICPTVTRSHRWWFRYQCGGDYDMASVSW